MTARRIATTDVAAGETDARRGRRAAFGAGGRRGRGRVSRRRDMRALAAGDGSHHFTSKVYELQSCERVRAACFQRQAAPPPEIFISPPVGLFVFVHWLPLHSHQKADQIRLPFRKIPCMSELREKRWSVLSERGCEVSGVDYDEAARLMHRLRGDDVHGLCIISDEAARRLSSNNHQRETTAEKGKSVVASAAAAAAPAKKRALHRKKSAKSSESS